MYFSGKGNMLYQPEFADIEKLRGLMGMLEDSSLWRNIGATNAVRVLGKGWGIPVFFMDFLKGFAPLLYMKCHLGGELAAFSTADMGWFLGVMFAVILAFVVLSVWIERRVAGWIQDRPGPNRAGIPLHLFQRFGSKEKQPCKKLLHFFGIPETCWIAKLLRWLRLDREIPTFGLMQPCLDGAKLFLKQELTPSYVRKFYFIIAPMLAAGMSRGRTFLIAMLTGVVESVIFKGVHYEMMVNTGTKVWKVHSTTMQPAGSRVGMSIVPFNIHIMHKEA